MPTYGRSVPSPTRTRALGATLNSSYAKAAQANSGSPAVGTGTVLRGSAIPGIQETSGLSKRYLPLPTDVFIGNYLGFPLRWTDVVFMAAGILAFLLIRGTEGALLGLTLVLVGVSGWIVGWD